MKRTPMKRSGPIARSTTPKKQAPSKRPALKTKQRPVTAIERALWGRLAALGCIACMKDGYLSPNVSIHHVDGRTKEGCHLLVLPLCAGHHQDKTGEDKTLLAVHPWKARFEKRFGAQLALVAECMALIATTKTKGIA